MNETEAPDYGDHAPKPSDSKLTELNQLVSDAIYSKDLIAHLTARVKQEEQTLKQLLEARIPELMQSCGLSDLTTAQGLRVKTKKELFANIPSPTSINDEKDTEKRERMIERRLTGLQWLSENGHDSIIKRSVKVEFDKGEESWARKFMADLKKRKRPLHAVEGAEVHPASLKKVLMELRKDGQPFPEETFGVFERTVATFSGR